MHAEIVVFHYFLNKIMLVKFNLVSRVVSNALFNTNLRSQFSAIPKVAGQAVGKKRFRLPVENDLNKLMTHCCGANYYKDGEDIKLKDDSEYPDWLWKLPTRPPRLHELDPNTKEYWEKAEIVGRQREWKLRGIANKRHMVVNQRIIDDMELKYRRRFRALAKHHFNAGYDIVEHHEREDTWNMHKKEKYRLPENSRPFYPGIDKVKLPRNVADMLIFRDNIKKAGHFGH